MIKRKFPGLDISLNHFILIKIIYFYLIGTYHLCIGKKAVTIWGWCREVCADPNNKYIPRVKNAGRIISGSLVMHNGLKVRMGEYAYYGDFANVVLKTNAGVHEPQEERVFMEVLKYIPENATMIELGSYWAFYSMWFAKNIKNPHCFMIEPEEKCLNCGKENFKLNNLTGTFIQGKCGKGGIEIDDFIINNKIDTAHIIHADIQGAELDMLMSCEQSIAKNKIWYFFISTHSQKLHYDCMEFLQSRDFIILASADFDYGTYCFDGVLVARFKGVIGAEPIEIALRRPNRNH
jgi:Methyltransferase FkbM domain